MKKFIISESEKKQIREMYGLIKESDDDDIIAYIDDYLSKKKCTEIADDMIEMKKTEVYTQLKGDDKTNYDNAIIGLKQPILARTFKRDIKCAKCQCVKDYMKQSFLESLKTDRDKVISSICGFTKLSPPTTPLAACQTNQKQPNTDNAVKSTDKVDNKSDDKPVVKSQPTIKTDIKVQNKVDTDNKGSVTSYEKTQRPSMKVDPFAN